MHAPAHRDTLTARGRGVRRRTRGTRVRRTPGRFTALVVSLLIVAAGCSGSDEVAPAATDATGAAAATAAPTATTAAATDGAGTVSDQEILDRLAEAQEATQAAGTAGFSLTQEITGIPGEATEATEADTGGEGRGLATSAEGSLDFDTGGLRMTITNQAATSLPGGGEVELLVDGETLYIRSPDTGGQWLSLPAADQDIDDELDPTGLLDDLTEAAVSAEEVGTEEIRGVETTRYEVTVDLEQQLEAATEPEEQEQLQRRIDTLGNPLVPTSLWIDADGRLRRQANEITIAGPDGEEVVVSQTIEFYDFGTDVDLDPPEDVVSLPDLPLPTEQ